MRDRKAELDSAARECFIKQKYVPGQRLEYDWGEVKIKESESKRKLSRLQKKFEKYDLAILDECGYKSLDKVAAEHLFNHISLRAGMKSTIITTNLGFDRWDEIFTDKIIAAAIVDRLTFKSFIIDMNGPSYRPKATEQWINERKNTDKRHK
ncbi:MAG: ATP-binding protein [Bacteroidales bacterium]|nr:ATP-binding protein [Candidatus Cacconaster scatequi]